jgi:hypothetical protein
MATQMNTPHNIPVKRMLPGHELSIKMYFLNI